MTEPKTTPAPTVPAVNSKTARKRKARSDRPAGRKTSRAGAVAEVSLQGRLMRSPSLRRVEPLGSDLPLGIRLQLHYGELARSHPEVESELVGRTELLGCHLLDGMQEDPAKQRVRVCFANYTRNCLIDVQFCGGSVERVGRRPSQCHPEAPSEMARAIELACSHPALKDHVAGLEARAILQVPPPRSPHRAHRCLLVVFSEQPQPELERRPRYSAFVDLNLQQVIRAGSAPS